MRTPWKSVDQKVILYNLYKFAEACGDYKQFTLTRLMDSDVESDGITPSQIFGLDKETLTAVLNGLSANYPEFIHVSFTLDLDNITLSDDKTSKDVLDLFK
jgi:phosphoadenosine phosphosulfate reductase